MKIAVVTTFNNKLYKKYAYRFMETYNWDFDLHVYSENAIPGSYIDLYSVPGCKEFVERNAERSAKDAQVSYKFDSVRFSYKIYAYTDFILNKAKDYDGVICIDADSVFYKPIGSKWIKEHIHRDDCMMGYLGRAGYYSECGFLYFNMNHKDTLDYAAEMKKMYDTDSLYKEKEYHEKITLKNFKAYVFGLRSGVSEKPSPGWNIIEEEGIEFLVELIKKEANISDAV